MLCVLTTNTAAVVALALLLVGCGTPEARRSERDRTVDAVGAAAAYRDWSGERLSVAATAARELSDATERRDLTAARRAYAAVLFGYEAARPAAERFGDLDRAIAAERVEVDGRWYGLRALERTLYGSASWPERQALTRALSRDLEELRTRVRSSLSLGAGRQVRAASHLLSDIEAYDLAGRSERSSGLTRRLALARLSGVQGIWRGLASTVRAQRPELARRVAYDLDIATRLLKGRSSRVLQVQAVDRAANSVAETAAVFR